MKERASLMGAEFDLESVPGSGTAISVGFLATRDEQESFPQEKEESTWSL
jgi:nitrate/nitrite-specific signal transduction histidine kinase